MMWPKVLAVFVFLVSEIPRSSSFRDTEVKLTSDSPAVLDSKITFKAVLYNSDSYGGPFYFRWSKSSFPDFDSSSLK
jgi:hypothetical protein